jgi:hypothetical protein
VRSARAPVRVGAAPGGLPACSLGAVLVLHAGARPLQAQIGGVRLPNVGRRSAGRGAAGGDKRPDSTLVKFLEPDSTMAALLARPGLTATRYQGDTVRFGAQTRVLQLEGRPAAVRRDETLLVGSDISYNDSTQIVIARPDSARGDTVFLRDATQADVAVRGAIEYYLAEQRGTIRQFQTAVTSGETWYVKGDRGALVTDSVIEGRRFVFARDGSVTSCNETVPHYHFESRDIKMVTRSLLVVRPAVLYIADVPVLWLPFVFQDMRSGRRSGLLTPRFGVAELIRNSAGYRRSLENLGYYFNFGNYADASAWLDWRSGSRGDGFDPGWLRANAETRYRIIDRFIQGRFSASYTAQRSGDRNLALSVGHEQSFNQNRRLSANLNYVQNTTVQRQNQLNPNAVLGTIASQLNYQDRFGPTAFSIGGSRKQYPGRAQVDQDFPNVNLTTQTLSLGENVAWTPTLSLSNTQSFDIDQGTQFGYVFRPGVGGAAGDSARVSASRRNTTVRMESPLKIFDFNWANSFSFSEEVRDFPETRPVYRDIRDTTTRETRTFNQTFLSSLDWNTSFNLPRFFQGSWNLSPDAEPLERRRRWPLRAKRADRRQVGRPAQAVLARRQLLADLLRVPARPRARRALPSLDQSGHQLELLARSARQRRVPERDRAHAAGLLRVAGPEPRLAAAADQPRGQDARPPSDGAGLGHLAALRQCGRADAGRSDARLGGARRSRRAGCRRHQRQRGAHRRRRLGGGRGQQGAPALDELHPADLRLRPRRLGGWEPVQQARLHRPELRHLGALRPGARPRLPHQLLALRGRSGHRHGRLPPYRTETSVSFSLDQNSAVFGTLARLFGRRIQPSSTTDAATPSQGRQGAVPGGDAFFARQAVAQQVAGSAARNAAFDMPSGQGFQASVTYTSSRQRDDIRGTTVQLDPTVACRALINQLAFVYESCLYRAQTAPPPNSNALGSTTFGGPIYQSPPQQSLTLNTSFPITQKWAAQWSTTYDAQRGGFASNQVNLQRELHDWRAGVRLHAVAQRQFRLQLLRRAQGPAGPEVRLQSADVSRDRRLGDAVGRATRRARRVPAGPAAACPRRARGRHSRHERDRGADRRTGADARRAVRGGRRAGASRPGPVRARAHGRDARGGRRHRGAGRGGLRRDDRLREAVRGGDPTRPAVRAAAQPRTQPCRRRRPAHADPRGARDDAAARQRAGARALGCPSGAGRSAARDAGSRRAPARAGAGQCGRERRPRAAGPPRARADRRGRGRSRAVDDRWRRRAGVGGPHARGARAEGGPGPDQRDAGTHRSRWAGAGRRRGALADGARGGRDVAGGAHGDARRLRRAHPRGARAAGQSESAALLRACSPTARSASRTAPATRACRTRTRCAACRRCTARRSTRCASPPGCSGASSTPRPTTRSSSTTARC